MNHDKNQGQSHQNPVISKPGLFKTFTFQSTALVLLAMGLLSFFIVYANDGFGVQSAVIGNASFKQTIISLGSSGFLPLMLIGVPIIGGIIQLFYDQKQCHNRDMAVLVTTLFTIVLVILSYPAARSGELHFALPNVMMLGLSFTVDMLGFTMLLLTSVIWFFVMVYAHEYMKKERHCNRFFLFMALTYSAVLGTIMAGDLLTMFLFFEVMTFASYALVTHGQRTESYEAGYNYIFMGLLGGFAILVALLLMVYTVGDLSFTSALAALSGHGAIQYVILGLLIFGFGIKAGMAPVHVWLPRAHPVAPTPASALLSGIMIKVGAYGILRVATSYFFPESSAVDIAPALWAISESMGAVIIWVGIITMAIGVFLALQQANIKRMLAYHSVSQMGYIVMGIGVALYLGSYGAMGYSGALYHIINHALFKSLLFMVAGVVYYHTREYDMYKLGGLWKKLPLSATVCLIAAFGISGMPLFNGFISKSILHHGIVEAYTYGSNVFFYAELIFILISAGTVCSFIKLFYYVFLRKPSQSYDHLNVEYNSLDTSLLAVAVLIILIGLFPRFILDALIVPQLFTTPYSTTFINDYIVNLAFFTAGDLFIMVIVIALGFVIFFSGTKFHWFHLKLPKWLKLEYVIFYPINLVMRALCKVMYGDRCPISTDTMSKLELRGNTRVGFLDRFIIMTSMFNRRYENTIIKSDAFIYTVAVTGVLLFMVLASIL